MKYRNFDYIHIWRFTHPQFFIAAHCSNSWSVAQFQSAPACAPICIRSISVKVSPTLDNWIISITGSVIRVSWDRNNREIYAWHTYHGEKHGASWHGFTDATPRAPVRDATQTARKLASRYSAQACSGATRRKPIHGSTSL